MSKLTFELTNPLFVGFDLVFSVGNTAYNASFTVFRVVPGISFCVKSCPVRSLSRIPDYSGSDMDFDTLLHAADDQMYAEKEILKK